MHPFVFYLLFGVALSTASIPKKIRKGRDSYLDAYTESHGGDVNLNKIKRDRESNYPSAGGVEYYPYPKPHPPSHQYGAPQPEYGSPSSYEPPHHNYGPPRPVYGPVPYPSHSYEPSSYGVPYGLLGIFDKFKLKLNLITIFKILLKIVLFKKLVSFIAIICLLLFIPWLKEKKGHHGGGDDVENDEEDDDSDMRRFANDSRGDERINNITVYILEAIEKFAKGDKRAKYECDTMYCRINKFARSASHMLTYQK